MISAYLDSIKEHTAKIVVSHGNGRVIASFNGNKTLNSITNDSMRVFYLSEVIMNSYLVGDIVYLGGTAVADSYVTEAFDKINHYSGIFTADLTGYSEITPDNGEGGAVESGSSGFDLDFYRSGSMTVTAGANPVTFIKNGVASPLSSSAYTVEAWVIANSGYRQNNLVITGQVAAGFTASDVLEAGTLYYIATLNT